MARSILVTGATGNQGGALIKALLQANADFRIYALTRNPASASAKALAESPSVEVVSGNLDDPEQIFAAISTKVWGVFSVQTPLGRGANAETEERQGKALVDAALSHGVEHIVYTSGDRGGKEKSDTTPTKVPTYAAKYRIEHYLKEKAASSPTPVTWTILRPVGFMDNLKPGVLGKVSAGIWRQYVPANKSMQYISAEDIGFFAAQAFIKADSVEYKNQALSIAGDELTFDQANALTIEKTGKPLPQTFRLLPWVAIHLVTELKFMFEWIAKEGPNADIAECRRLHPGLLSFGEWVELRSGLKQA